MSMVMDSHQKLTMYGSSDEQPRMETEYRQNILPAPLLTVEEVGRFLHVHSNTIRRWERKGLLKSYSIGLGNNLRFSLEEVLDFLNKCRKPR